MEVTEKHVREIHEGGGYGNYGGYGCVNDKLRRTGNLAGWATGLSAVAAAGALGLFGNNRCGGGLNLFGNNNCAPGVVAAEAAVIGAPNVWSVQSKECEDVLALTTALYRGELAQQEQRFEDRGVDVREKVAIDQKINANEMKTQQDFFNLYKGMRDMNDATNARITEIEKREIATSTALPYQFALVDCKINNTAEHAAFNLERRTSRMLTGTLVAPTTPLISGVPSPYCCCGGVPTPPPAV